jgi:hypothetical protein
MKLANQVYHAEALFAALSIGGRTSYNEKVLTTRSAASE